MEALQKEHDRLAQRSNLSKSINDIQKTIDLLKGAREAIANGTFFAIDSSGAFLGSDTDVYVESSPASITLAKLQNPVKSSFEAIGSDMTDVHKGLSAYQRALKGVRLL